MKIFNISWKIKRTISSVKPDPALLTSILEKLPADIGIVTKSNVNRIIEAEEALNGGRHFHSNKISNLINIMSKSVKIMSGGAVAAALIVAAVFITGDNKYSPVIDSTQNDVKTYEEVKNNTAVTETKVAVAGETIDVDSLIVDLVAADYTFEEPIYDDSDLTIELINSNYEIQ
jgi:hypothetical protein